MFEIIWINLDNGGMFSISFLWIYKFIGYEERGTETFLTIRKRKFN